MRYEIKYVMDQNADVQFTNWLLSSPFLRRSYPDRNVHSIYFDTAELASARDNINGLFFRKKFRLRWYSDLNNKDPISTDLPIFEIKIKKGRLGEKSTRILNGMNMREIFFSNPHLLTTTIRDRLSAEDWPELGARLDFLTPKVLINYQRSYFLGPENIRVTVDKNLSFCDVQNLTVDPNKQKVVFTKSIVEFKFSPKSYDQSCHIMASLPFFPSRNSKYLLAMACLGYAVYI